MLNNNTKKPIAFAIEVLVKVCFARSFYEARQVIYYTEDNPINKFFSCP